MNLSIAISNAVVDVISLATKTEKESYLISSFKEGDNVKLINSCCTSGFKIGNVYL